MDYDVIWLISYYLLLIWIAVTIGLAVRGFLYNSKIKTQSRIELEQLQKEELKKRIALLDKELKEKEGK